MAKKDKEVENGNTIPPLEIVVNTLSLTEEQKTFLRETFPKSPDITILTRHLFGPDKDKRSREGKLIRNFILSEGLESKVEVEELVLDEEQKAKIDQLYLQEEIGVGGISAIIFPDAVGGNYSKEWKVITAYLCEAHDYKQEGRIKFDRPKTFKEIADRLNTLNVGKKIDIAKLTIVEKQQLEALLASTCSERFKRTVEGYLSRKDKLLFEDSFYRTTYDKPDLTVDEINLYISLCDGYVKIANIKEQMSKLNRMFDETEDSADMTIKLTEAIQAKNKDLHDTESRGEKLIAKLNGNRAERLAKRGVKTANLLALVQVFQNKEERDRMMKIAGLQRLAVEKEIDRLETAPEFIARIVGISKFSAI